MLKRCSMLTVFVIPTHMVLLNVYPYIHVTFSSILINANFLLVELHCTSQSLANDTMKRIHVKS